MTKQKRFDQAVKNFQLRTAELSGVFAHTFPEGYDLRTHPDISGHAIEMPLKPVRDCIDNVMEAFDAIQLAIGLPPGDRPRHHRYLHGDD